MEEELEKQEEQKQDGDSKYSYTAIAFRCLTRRLVPRQHKVDAPVVQKAVFSRICRSRKNSNSSHFDGHGSSSLTAAAAVMVGGRLEQTLVNYEQNAPPPFYYPRVSRFSFVYEEFVKNENKTCSSSEDEGISTNIDLGHVFIEYHPIDHEPDSPHHKRLNHILDILLSKVVKFGKGRISGYQKRVHHDVNQVLCTLSSVRSMILRSTHEHFFLANRCQNHLSRPVSNTQGQVCGEVDAAMGRGN